MGKGLIMLGMLHVHERFRYDGQDYFVIKNDGKDTVVVKSVDHNHISQIRANIYVYHTEGGYKC